DLTAGYSYLSVQEELSVRADVPPATTRGPAQVAFDLFRTRNEFHGGQVGVTTAYQCGRLTAQAEVALALGTTQETARVRGVTAGRRRGPGGLRAQRGKSGVFHHREFSAVPQIGLKAAWQLNAWVRMTVGYNLLVWTGVARPGDQISAAVSPATGAALPF